MRPNVALPHASSREQGDVLVPEAGQAYNIVYFPTLGWFLGEVRQIFASYLETSPCSNMRGGSRRKAIVEEKMVFLG